jgi:hypothetical protein
MIDRTVSESIDYHRSVEAIGWLSAELAARADAWNGNAPEWFPEPPEWLELWNKALEATGA